MGTNNDENLAWSSLPSCEMVDALDLVRGYERRSACAVVIGPGAKAGGASGERAAAWAMVPAVRAREEEITSWLDEVLIAVGRPSEVGVRVLENDAGVRFVVRGPSGREERDFPLACAG